MVKPDEYRAGYVRRMSQHVFNLYNRRGQKQEFFHELVRLLHRELGSQESFIGVVPVGSTVRGHSIPPTEATRDIKASDLDIVILYDSSKGKNAGRKLMRIARGEDALFAKKYKGREPPPLAGGSPHDLNIERVRKFLQMDYVNLDDDGLNVLQGIAALAGLAVGPGVETYRHAIGQEIRKLPGDRIDALVNHIGAFMAALELSDSPNSPSKMIVQMLPNESDSTIRSMMHQRAMPWVERVIRVFGLN